MPSQTFTSLRTTWPDEATLQTQLRAALDPTAGFFISRDTRAITVKKSTAWTAPQISAAQTTIDNAPAQTPQSLAQAEIDAWPISLRAIVDVLRDEINLLRTEINTLRAAVSPPLTPPLTQRTRAQALQAVRDKAGTLPP